MKTNLFLTRILVLFVSASLVVTSTAGPRLWEMVSPPLATTTPPSAQALWLSQEEAKPGAYDQHSQELAVGNGVASSSDDHALREMQEAEGQRNPTLEELELALRTTQPLSPNLTQQAPVPAASLALAAAGLEEGTLVTVRELLPLHWLEKSGVKYQLLRKDGNTWIAQAQEAGSSSRIPVEDLVEYQFLHNGGRGPAVPIVHSAGLEEAGQVVETLDQLTIQDVASTLDDRRVGSFELFTGTIAAPNRSLGGPVRGLASGKDFFGYAGRTGFSERLALGAALYEIQIIENSPHASLGKPHARIYASVPPAAGLEEGRTVASDPSLVASGLGAAVQATSNQQQVTDLSAAGLEETTIAEWVNRATLNILQDGKTKVLRLPKEKTVWIRKAAFEKQNQLGVVFGITGPPVVPEKVNGAQYTLELKRGLFRLLRPGLPLLHTEAGFLLELPLPNEGELLAGRAATLEMEQAETGIFIHDHLSKGGQVSSREHVRIQMESDRIGFTDISTWGTFLHQEHAYSLAQVSPTAQASLPVPAPKVVHLRHDPQGDLQIVDPQHVVRIPEGEDRFEKIWTGSTATLSIPPDGIEVPIRLSSDPAVHSLRVRIENRDGHLSLQVLDGSTGNILYGASLKQQVKVTLGSSLEQTIQVVEPTVHWPHVGRKLPTPLIADLHATLLVKPQERLLQIHDGNGLGPDPNSGGRPSDTGTYVGEPILLVRPAAGLEEGTPVSARVLMPLDWLEKDGVKYQLLRQDGDTWITDSTLRIPVANLVEYQFLHNGGRGPAVPIVHSAGLEENQPGVVSEPLMEALRTDRANWGTIASGWIALSPQDGREVIGRVIGANQEGSVILLGPNYWNNGTPERITVRRAAFEHLSDADGRPSINHLLAAAPEGLVVISLDAINTQGPDMEVYDELAENAAPEITSEIRRRVGLTAAGLEDSWEWHNQSVQFSEKLDQAMKQSLPVNVYLAAPSATDLRNMEISRIARDPREAFFSQGAESVGFSMWQWFLRVNPTAVLVFEESQEKYYLLTLKQVQRLNRRSSWKSLFALQQEWFEDWAIPVLDEVIRDGQSISITRENISYTDLQRVLREVTGWVELHLVDAAAERELYAPVGPSFKYDIDLWGRFGQAFAQWVMPRAPLSEEFDFPRHDPGDLPVVGAMAGEYRFTVEVHRWKPSFKVKGHRGVPETEVLVSFGRKYARITVLDTSAAGLEETAVADVATLEPPAVAPGELARTASQLEQLLAQGGARHFDGLTEINLALGQGDVAPDELFEALLRHPNGSGQSVLVPIRVSATDQQKPLILWAQRGLNLPDQLEAQLRELSDQIGEAKETLQREAGPSQVAFLNTDTGMAAGREAWENLLGDFEMVGIGIKPGAALDVNPEDIPTLVAVAFAQGGSLYILGMTTVEFEGERHLLIFL